MNNRATAPSKPDPRVDARPLVSALPWSQVLHTRIHEILKLKHLPHARRIVLLWLALRLKKAGIGYPSTAIGSRLCGMDRPEFEGHLIALALAGHINIRPDQKKKKRDGSEAVQIQITLSKKQHQREGVRTM